ncbi:MAG: hypothetical protein M3N18_01195 [Actinomycetota bacterium]|nr:hypothetical protein [Actinomycetota bacterium]
MRPDTTLVPVGEPENEVYVRGLPGCCLVAFKEAVMEGGDRRLSELRCTCGQGWHVTRSLDERVLRRFVMQGESRANNGGSHPAA